MPTVNIYLMTDLKGPSKRNGRYLFVIEFISAKGEKATLTCGGVEQSVTENMIYLRAFARSLGRLKKPSNIQLHIENRYFRNTWSNSWPIIWSKNNWVKANGSKASNADEWAQILTLLEPHTLTLAPYYSANVYENWMKEELEIEDYVKKYTAS